MLRLERLSKEERAVLTDLYCREVIHRAFSKAALSGVLPDQDTQLLSDLEFTLRKPELE